MVDLTSADMWRIEWECDEETARERQERHGAGEVTDVGNYARVMVGDTGDVLIDKEENVYCLRSELLREAREDPDATITRIE